MYQSPISLLDFFFFGGGGGVRVGMNPLIFFFFILQETLFYAFTSYPLHHLITKGEPLPFCLFILQKLYLQRLPHVLHTLLCSYSSDLQKTFPVFFTFLKCFRPILWLLLTLCSSLLRAVFLRLPALA